MECQFCGLVNGKKSFRRYRLLNAYRALMLMNIIIYARHEQWICNFLMNHHVSLLDQLTGRSAIISLKGFAPQLNKLVLKDSPHILYIETQWY